MGGCKLYLCVHQSVCNCVKYIYKYMYYNTAISYSPNHILVRDI